MGFQQRKKDYLQRLIEEFFSKFQLLLNSEKPPTSAEKERLLVDGFKFFSDNLDVQPNDLLEDILQKVTDYDLLEQYARLVMMEFDLLEEDGDKLLLQKALEIVEYLQNVDNTFSWERTILHEDILRLLNNN